MLRIIQAAIAGHQDEEAGHEIEEGNPEPFPGTLHEWDCGKRKTRFWEDCRPLFPNPIQCAVRTATGLLVSSNVHETAGWFGLVLSDALSVDLCTFEAYCMRNLRLCPIHQAC